MPHFGIGEWTWQQPAGEQGWWTAPRGLAGGLDLRPLSEQAIAGTSHSERRGKCLVASPIPLGSDFVSLGEGNAQDLKTDQRMRDAFAAGTGWTPEGDTFARLVYDLFTRGSHPDGELGIRPLLPGGGRLQILLPGCGRIWSEPFQFGKHSHSHMVRDVERLNYRAIHREGTKTHEKFLGWLGLKYSLKAPQDVFIPADLPKISPRQPATTYTDNFNRADSTNLGGSWTEIQNDVQIVSNGVRRATNGFDCLARYDSDLSGSDQTSRVNTSSAGLDGGVAGGMLRKDGTGTVTCYVGFADWANDRGEISKIISGTRTTLSTGATITLSANTAGPDLRARCFGSSLYIDLGASPYMGSSDSSVTTGLRCGIFVRGTASAAGIALDWEGSDWSGPVSIGGGGSGAVGSGGGGIVINNPIVLTPAGIA